MNARNVVVRLAMTLRAATLAVCCTMGFCLADGAALSMHFINGGEFPGAKGRVGSSGEGYVLAYDFTGGGAYVEMRHEFGPDGCRLETVSCRLKAPANLGLHLRFVDATGQHFIKGFKSADGEWHDYRISVGPRWWSFGGANDGKLHLPLKSLSIGLDKTDGVAPVGELAVDDLRLIEQVGFPFVADKSGVVPRYPVQIDGRLAKERGGELPTRVLDVSVTNVSVRAFRGAFALEVRDWDCALLTSVRSGAVELPTSGEARHTFTLPEVPAEKNFTEYVCRFVGEDGKPLPAYTWSRTWTRPVAGDVEPRPAPSLTWGMGSYLYRNGNDAAGRRRLAYAADLTRNLGAKWIREEFNWQKIEPERGRPDFGFYDYLVETAVSNGLCVVGMFAYWTPWTKPYTEEGYADYCRTLSRLVSRYRGKVDRWEIWNEPDIPFWNGPKKEYYALLSRAYATVKAANPDAEVWGFSTSGISRSFILDGLAAGAKFDRISVHPYTGLLREREFMSNIAWVWEKSGGRRVPLTEMGWSTWRGGTSERLQATLLVRAQMAAAATGKTLALFPYWLFDGWLFDDSEHNYGIVHQDGTLKPAYRAMAQVFRAFAQGSATLEFVPLGEGVEALAFAMDGRSAVWTDYESPVTLSVPTAAGLSAVNLMGESVTLERAGDRILFRCDVAHPIFFNGLVGRPAFVSSSSPIKRIISF